MAFEERTGADTGKEIGTGGGLRTASSTPPRSAEATRLSVNPSCPVLSNGMDSWPTNTKARSTNQKRRGKQKRTTEGLPLHFEAGAVTAATLQQNNGRLVWTSVSENIKGTVQKLVARYPNFN